ncbi:hypothetical protein NC653_034811 [Populus alba x Populus x berolinensis]|uniref:Uncharacterized protein n=1 Tax=Populus alba x Populus x berolinensis TaxID=444605 RepID=A0AAD6LNN4_9ROSI|nr:hypothetical protein NC653_034811 [Populus alba x Populus x berolinensis]
MILRRGGVDFLRFFLLSCFSAVYSRHILSDSIAMIVRRGGVDFLIFLLLSCFSAVYSSHILSDSIAMIVRRGGVDFLRFLLLSCFSAAYSSHILSDSIHRLCGGTTPWNQQAGFVMSLSANHFWCVAIVIIWLKNQSF